MAGRRGEVRILGPIEVCGPHGRAALSGARQRTLVAVLALHAGTTVSTERLVDVLWGDDPPRTAVKSLHSHVARVRQALADCGMPSALVTKTGGYQLDAQVDAQTFERTKDLSLWRGEPLADAELFGWGRAEIDRLAEQHISAQESWWDGHLGHADAVAELNRLLVRHPTRERLTALLMRALHRAGRHTDALDAFQRLRSRLAEDLGVDPSPDLTDLHAAILRGDPALRSPGTAPAELPARAGHFTGRTAEFAALAGLPPIVVVSGIAGVGKTTFAVEWAHRVAGEFPDGQIFVDLQRCTPTQALTRVLHSLGVSQVPPDPESLYRTLLHGKRFLILLDNVRSARDVFSLVPGDPANLLLITSRDALSALGARHAVHTVRLDLLDETEALTLMTDVLGAARVESEKEATAQLTLHCGRLPLALRIAAARLAARPSRRIGDLVRELTHNDPLDVLAVEGDDRTVRTVFASAHRTLSPQAAALFRLLGEHPGTSFPADLADALGPGLDELVTSHLVSEVADGRYQFHDLIRLFARQCGDLGDGVARLLDRYLAVAHAANRMLNPRNDRVVREETADLPFDRAHVLEYLDAERDSVLPLLRLALEHGLRTQAWQLTYLWSSYFEARGHWAARVEQCELAVTAASGDTCAEAEMLRALGVAYFMTRRLADAITVQQRALVLAAGDARAEGRLHNNIGTTSAELRAFGQAVASFESSMAAYRRAGDEAGIALAQRNLGYAWIGMGHPERATEPLFAALATFRAAANARLEAGTLMSLGTALWKLGDLTAAGRHFADALVLSRRVGDQPQEADALAGLALVANSEEHLEEALVVCRRIGDRHREATVLHHLAEICLRHGDLSAARAHLVDALATRARARDVFEQARVHRTFAELEGRCTRWTEAARHWAAAIDLFRAARVT